MAVLLRSDGRVEIVIPKGNVFTLEEIQGYVGGYIEAVYAINATLREIGTFDVMIINEDGKRLELPVNLMASAIYEHGARDPIVGDVVLCKLENAELR